MGKQWIPPKDIGDLDNRSAGNLVSLTTKMKNSPVSLVLGAGVSAAAGLPAWSEFLNRICQSFFMHWELQIKSGKRTPLLPPKNMSIAGSVDEYMSCSPAFENTASRLASRDPILVAQQVRGCIREQDWRYLCIKVLNQNDGYEINKRCRLLRALAKLCSVNGKVKAVVNYNYDNLFETYLKDRHVKHSTIWEHPTRSHKSSIPVYHPHGCLPIKGGPSSATFVLTESDYHSYSVEPYSWANLIQSQVFSTSICVFLGTSMIDPNIRRLLRVSSTITSEFHYAFLPRSRKQSQTEIMLNALFDRDLHKLGVKTIRYPKTSSRDNPYSRLASLVEFMNQQT